MSKLQKEMQERQQSPLEYVVYSGGGAKGGGYSGVLEALNDSEVINKVKEVAGSSAGAIAAAVTAFGIPPKEYEAISKNTNFKDLLGTQGFSIGPVPLNKDGTPLYELVDKTIRKVAYNFLKGKNFVELATARHERISEELRELDKKRQDLLNTIETLKQQDDNNSQQIADINENIQGLDFQEQNFKKQSMKIQAIIESNGKEFIELTDKCQKGGELLFRDLALLRLLDPVQFKGLLITAVRRDDSTLQIFSAENTPDVPIARACHASASLPLVFQPVEIDGVEYVDGGYRDNTPMDYFPENDSKVDVTEELDGFQNVTRAKKQGRVLALAFGSGMDDSANIAIYSAKNFEGPNALVKFLIDVVYKMLAKVGGNLIHTKTNEKTFDDLRENALDTVALNTGPISTLSFDAAKKYAPYLHTKAYLQTSKYLKNLGLGKEVNKAFEQQEFLLSVYEVYDNENLNKTFFNKLLDHIAPPPPEETKKKNSWQDRDVMRNHQEKADTLLSFCTKERWEGKDNKAVLKEYVLVAATARSNELRNDTKSIESLIKTLNNPTTPNKIKKDFIELLAIDQKQEPRFNTSKSPAQNITEFKFKKRDFDNLLGKNKSEAFRISSGGKGVGQ
ncbi:patatin-like phospholipase family protein [Candidatus Tisiphia endosymbiont of Ptychoptera albimana]|uniref:patatin-like phospholipase family protein n=1 Tax=Candidatus Tisiphia endosymbiont of Ptychoptera albimana TaxID=3066260 RepID=UPI00312C6D64